MAKQTHKPKSALTREEVQEELGIGYATFFNYIRKYPRHFRTYKSGRNRVMDPEDLQAWKEFCKQRDAY